jgi:small subunit ribosomal protein S7
MATKKTETTVNNFFPVLSKYNIDDVKVEDKGLERYINLSTENIYLGGIYANKLFAKSKMPIVERLINNIMRTENYTGKKTKAYKVVRNTFEIISVPKAVDIAPQRRLDLAIRNICKGSVNASHKNKKSMEACLSDEIIKASKNDVSSFAVAKKNDVERVAKSAR